MKCDLATPQVNMKPDSFTFPFDQQIASTYSIAAVLRFYTSTDEIHVPGTTTHLKSTYQAN